MPGRAVQGLRQVFKLFGGQRIFGNTVKKVTNLLAETASTQSLMQIGGPAHRRAFAFAVPRQNFADHHILLGPGKQLRSELHPGQKSRHMRATQQIEGIRSPRAGGRGRHAAVDTPCQLIAHASSTRAGRGQHQKPRGIAPGVQKIYRRCNHALSLARTGRPQDECSRHGFKFIGVSQRYADVSSA